MISLELELLVKLPPRKGELQIVEADETELQVNGHLKDNQNKKEYFSLLPARSVVLLINRR